jgi:acetyl esterase
MPDLKLDELVLHHAASAACALPTALQRVLAGGPIVRDGQTLDPEIALLMRLSERTGRQLPRNATPAFIRAQQNKGARIAGGPRDAAHAVDLTIAGPAGPMAARHYAASEPDAPLLVYLHGGGFVFGDLDTHDAPCRVLRRHGGMHVLSVEYRLAPEHPFPAAVEDARAALRWAHDHARELGADPDRVGVGGDSAGANLAAVVAQLAVRDGGPAPACQLLVYPAVDRRQPWPSLELFGDGFYLTRDAIDWFHLQYAGANHRATAPDARLNPLAGEDLAGLARALVVTAGFDPLRDEGEAYAKKLRDSGNDVTVRRFESLVHGFFNMVGVSRVCREAVVEIAGATRILFSKRSS